MKDAETIFYVMLAATLFYCLGHITGYRRFLKKFNNVFGQTLAKSDDFEQGSRYKLGWLACLDFFVNKII